MSKGLKEAPAYNHYFLEGRLSEGHKKKDEKENKLKNQSRVMREGREENRKQNNTQTSFLSQNKRVSSAKPRREKKERKVVFERAVSKKSLKND